VSWDGIRIGRVSSGAIEAIAWDAPQGRECRFVLDATTGRTIEGVSPRA
jgi:hypothetical protein